jgi:hypothetical protein
MPARRPGRGRTTRILAAATLSFFLAIGEASVTARREQPPPGDDHRVAEAERTGELSSVFLSHSMFIST